MDNRQINIRAEEKADFILSMKLAVDARKTVGYTVTKEGALVLFWSECKGETFFNKLPYEMTVEQITEFAWGWLCSVNPNEPEPDHDGSNGKGFEMFCDHWGHVIDRWEAYIGIRPIWAMYGK